MSTFSKDSLRSNDPAGDTAARCQQERPIVGALRAGGCDLYHAVVGEGVPILLIYPAGATVSTWAGVRSLVRARSCMPETHRGRLDGRQTVMTILPRV